MVVSALHRKQECKVEKLLVQEVGGQAAEDQKQMQTSNTWINYRGSVHMKFNSHDYFIQSIIYQWRIIKLRGREGGGGVKREGAY